MIPIAHCHLIATWGNRPETAVSVAERLHQQLACMAAYDATFSRWYRVGRSRPDTLRRPIETSVASLQAFVERAGRDREPGEGYALSSIQTPWTDKEFLSVLVYAGATPERPFSTPINMVDIEPLVDQAGRTKFLNRELVTALMACVVSAWVPMGAAVESHSWYWAMGNRGSGPPLGWLTYLAVEPNRMPALAFPTVVEPLGNGVLITATPTPPDVSNPGDVEALRHVRTSLTAAGLRGPIDWYQPWQA